MELSDDTEKTPATPGIHPRTFRLVAQCLNHYATPGPNFILYFEYFLIDLGEIPLYLHLLPLPVFCTFSISTDARHMQKNWVIVSLMKTGKMIAVLYISVIEFLCIWSTFVDTVKFVTTDLNIMLLNFKNRRHIPFSFNRNKLHWLVYRLLCRCTLY
jgi:hypothetical protein